jgi:RNA polymerase subunit RPABC4/transcription elongation factor Spt4
MHNPWPRPRKRVFSVQLCWADYPTEYTTVRATTEEGAETAASLRLYACGSRGRPDLVILHDDGGSKARAMKIGRRNCQRCGRLVKSERHKCPHGVWCRAQYARRGVGQANACPLCPSNGLRRALDE